MGDIRVYSDASSLARAAAERFVALAGEAVATRGRFAVALSGGSTPRATYELLASTDFAPRVDWASVHIFWGDERAVPPDHAHSNYHKAREALLDKVPVPRQNAHRIRGELPPAEAASAYREELQAVLGTDGLLDLVFLGMGTDGHTASLFPGTSALEERERAVAAVYVEPLQAWRVTLTLPAINSARHVQFLVTGAAKAGVVQAVLEGSGARYPAQQIRPGSGRLVWMLDAAAASQLRTRPITQLAWEQQ